MFTLICPASPLTYSSRLIAFVVNLDLSSSILLFLATVFLALLAGVAPVANCCMITSDVACSFLNTSSISKTFG